MSVDEQISIPLPIPMLLHCPECRTRHIDIGEFATKIHHTHSCQACGHTWRPAVVATVGVRFLPGFQNTEELMAATVEFRYGHRVGYKDGMKYAEALACALGATKMSEELMSAIKGFDGPEE